MMGVELYDGRYSFELCTYVAGWKISKNITLHERPTDAGMSKLNREFHNLVVAFFEEYKAEDKVNALP